MPANKVIEFEGIGAVAFYRRKRSRYLKITVEPFSGPRVSVPWGASYSEAVDMVRAHVSWVERELEKTKALEKDYESLFQSLPPMSREQARRKLLTRLCFLAQRHGFSYNRVFIRAQKTVWGSCSVKNNINLNIKLAFMPEELMDYVILHELVHTRVKKHNAAFWQELARFIPEPRLLDRRLKRYAALLYAGSEFDGG